MPFLTADDLTEGSDRGAGTSEFRFTPFVKLCESFNFNRRSLAEVLRPKKPQALVCSPSRAPAVQTICIYIYIYKPDLGLQGLNSETAAQQLYTARPSKHKHWGRGALSSEPCFGLDFAIESRLGGSPLGIGVDHMGWQLGFHRFRVNW